MLSCKFGSRRKEKYGEEMERRHGARYDWRNTPIDGDTVYAGGDGKAHGQ
jgi:hypothetical protein